MVSELPSTVSNRGSSGILLTPRNRIQDNRNACTLCNDVDAEHVVWVYRFFFLVEDKDGDRLVVDCCSEGVSSNLYLLSRFTKSTIRAKYCQALNLVNFGVIETNLWP